MATSARPILLVACAAAVAAGFLALSFGAQASVRPEIHVTADVIRQMEAEHAAALGRSLRPEELRDVARKHVEDEIVVREATRRGIDCEQCVSMREIVTRLHARLGLEPDEARRGDLRRLYEAHRAEYRAPERVTFEHVYQAEEPTGAQVRAWRDALETGADPASLGQGFWLGTRLASVTRDEVAAVFGGAFADRILDGAMRSQDWHGPVRSVRGFHLLRIVERKAGRPAELDEVRIQLERRLERRRHAALRAAVLRQVEPLYRIRIDLPSKGL